MDDNFEAIVNETLDKMMDRSKKYSVYGTYTDGSANWIEDGSLEYCLGIFETDERHTAYVITIGNIVIRTSSFYIKRFEDISRYL